MVAGAERYINAPASGIKVAIPPPFGNGILPSIPKLEQMVPPANNLAEYLQNFGAEFGRVFGARSFAQAIAMAEHGFFNSNGPGNSDAKTSSSFLAGEIHRISRALKLVMDS